MGSYYHGFSREHITVSLSFATEPQQYFDAIATFLRCYPTAAVLGMRAFYRAILRDAIVGLLRRQVHTGRISTCMKRAVRPDDEYTCKKADNALVTTAWENPFGLIRRTEQNYSY